jgi:heme/copper-type cytochrome/quinol oxidase subunit 4
MLYLPEILHLAQKMKRTHLSRTLFSFSIIICLTLMMGTLHAFAAPQPTLTPPASATPELTPAAAQSTTPDLTLEPLATPDDELASADTTAVIAFAVAMVVIVIFGVLWGGRSTPRAAKGKK